MIAESNRAKQVVSRSYPTSFGTVWSCDYAITVPDNTKKILVEFQDMLLIGKQFPEGKNIYFIQNKDFLTFVYNESFHFINFSNLSFFVFIHHLTIT
jgi:hypothetical protein